eukprot:2504463-Rhodomonas_salina.1
MLCTGLEVCWYERHRIILRLGCFMFCTYVEYAGTRRRCGSVGPRTSNCSTTRFDLLIAAGAYAYLHTQSGTDLARMVLPGRRAA